MAVSALRDVFGIAHPAFLCAADLGADLELPELVVPLSSSSAGTPEDEPLAVMPDDARELHDLVDAALVPLFGQMPEKDDDGDIPVPSESSLVYVRVHDYAPIVELFGMVAEGVKDVDRATFEVAVLNRDVRFIKFVLIEDRVLASIQIPAWPFVPEHLRSLLTGMSASLDASMKISLRGSADGGRWISSNRTRGRHNSLRVSGPRRRCRRTRLSRRFSSSMLMAPGRSTQGSQPMCATTTCVRGRRRLLCYGGP